MPSVVSSPTRRVARDGLSVEPDPATHAGTASPSTTQECAELLTSTSGSVLVRGAGTKQGWAGRVEDPDLVLSTSRLTGVLTYDPADMTASCRAGTPLAELQDHLRGQGQWLALDPAGAERGATLGGLLATSDAGPTRTSRGSLRDLVIGVRLVLADGTVARSGGHVIKNVAGYDLAKLVLGSLGTLAVVTEVVVRLHPLPPASVTVAAPADARQATTAALAVMAGPVEPAALEWVSPDGADGELLVRLDGAEEGCRVSARRTAELLAEQGLSATQLDDAQHGAAWDRRTAASLGVQGETHLRVSGLPSAVVDVATALRDDAGAAGVGVGVVSTVCLGLATVSLSGEPSSVAGVAARLREREEGRGASVLLLQRPDEVDALLEPLGQPPSTVALLRRVKERFDPDGRLAPGRMSPWY